MDDEKSMSSGGTITLPPQECYIFNHDGADPMIGAPAYYNKYRHHHRSSIKQLAPPIRNIINPQLPGSGNNSFCGGIDTASQLSDSGDESGRKNMRTMNVSSSSFYQPSSSSSVIWHHGNNKLGSVDDASLLDSHHANTGHHRKDHDTIDDQDSNKATKVASSSLNSFFSSNKEDHHLKVAASICSSNSDSQYLNIRNNHVIFHNTSQSSGSKKTDNSDNEVKSVNSKHNSPHTDHHHHHHHHSASFLNSSSSYQMNEDLSSLAAQPTEYDMDTRSIYSIPNTNMSQNSSDHRDTMVHVDYYGTLTTSDNPTSFLRSIGSMATSVDSKDGGGQGAVFLPPNTDRSSFNNTSQYPISMSMGVGVHADPERVLEGTSFPAAMSYAASEAAKSDIATVCSGSVAEDIDIVSIMSGEMNTNINTIHQTPSSLNASGSFGGGGGGGGGSSGRRHSLQNKHDRVVEFAAETSTVWTHSVYPSYKAPLQQTASTTAQRLASLRSSPSLGSETNFNDMGPPLSRSLLLERVVGSTGSVSRAGSVRSFGSQAPSENLVHVDTDDCGGSLMESEGRGSVMEDENHSVTSHDQVDGADDMNHENNSKVDEFIATKTDKEDDTNEGDSHHHPLEIPPCSASLSSLRNPSSSTNGRTSPGGTVYKGRGVRRYQGRYMNLPLKRFHHNGVTVPCDPDAVEAVPSTCFMEPEQDINASNPYLYRDERWAGRQRSRSWSRSRSRSRSRSPSRSLGRSSRSRSRNRSWSRSQSPLNRPSRSRSPLHDTDERDFRSSRNTGSTSVHGNRWRKNNSNNSNNYSCMGGGGVSGNNTSGGTFTPRFRNNTHQRRGGNNYNNRGRQRWQSPNRMTPRDSKHNRDYSRK